MDKLLYILRSWVKRSLTNLGCAGKQHLHCLINIENNLKIADSIHCLPEGLCQTLPPADRAWIANALFRYSSSTLKPELDERKLDRLWYYPPPPQSTSNLPPKMDRYFTQRLFVWMPKRLWQVILGCTSEGCEDSELILGGIYRNARQILDIDGMYNMIGEVYQCSLCKRKYLSWSQEIIAQLDISHRLQFPAILTYKYGCDIRVVRLLRERGLGNSSTMIRKKMTEEHGEAWMQSVTHYLGDCSKFKKASMTGLVCEIQFQEPPPQPVLPQAAWFMRLYIMDVMSRIEDVKAAITSTFGRVIKIDSTKKVTKKLAGRAAGTAAWQTNVGNEFGQVLMSVLTSGEGYGLAPMARGLMDRYTRAKVPPPSLLYVDRDCCSGNMSKLFPDWPGLVVKLDIWHFMRRIAAVVTTEAHPLYSVFMGRLARCIFEWDKDDLAKLREAKEAEMGAAGIHSGTWITKKELSLHCRRKTRGAEETEREIYNLLLHFSGDAGRDPMGVPLLDKDRVWVMWEAQRRHIPCIQDPPNIALYNKVGILRKGGIPLPVYRCARGSTSLESFHLHVNRFIPGTCARDVYFQGYLLDGLVRWNENRAAAIKDENYKHDPSQPTYSGLLRQAINEMSDNVFGKKIFPNFHKPLQYSGELIGVEYLYSQTGEVLQDLGLKHSEDNEDNEEEHSDDNEDNEEMIDV